MPSVLKSIHEILASDSNADALALSALLPTERIVTGQNHARDLPYASVNMESNLSNYRSNAGSARDQRIRFQLWHDNHADGSEITEAIEELFESKAFETEDIRLIKIRHENTLAIQEPDGTWQFTIDFITTK